MFRCHAGRLHWKTIKPYVCRGKTRNRSVSALLGWKKWLRCTTVKVKHGAIPGAPSYPGLGYKGCHRGELSQLDLLLRESLENPRSHPEIHSALTAKPVSNSVHQDEEHPLNRLTSHTPPSPGEGSGRLHTPQAPGRQLPSPEPGQHSAASGSSSLEKKAPSPPRSTHSAGAASDSVCICAGAQGVWASPPWVDTPLFSLPRLGS